LMRTIEEYHNIYVTVLHTFHIILLMWLNQEGWVGRGL
jgi:hypothetical protein